MSHMPNIFCEPCKRCDRFRQECVLAGAIGGLCGILMAYWMVWMGGSR